MPIPKSDKIWFNGDLVGWDKAQVHVLSHVVHYGSSVFEGMRCYETPKGSACFRLTDHVNRLFDSAKIYRMDIPYSRETIYDAIVETVRVNKLNSCYVRPIVFRGYGELGVNPLSCPVEVVIAVWEWGENYLGPEALEKGVSVRFASWNRLAPNTMPALAKVGANYMNSQLIKMEAMADGYAEGIALDTQGYVSEGSGENIFMVKNGAIFTPSTGSSILPGITRHSVIALAEEMEYSITTRPIPREALYIADEVFLTGTAAKITPIKKIESTTLASDRPVMNKLKSMLTQYSPVPWNIGFELFVMARNSDDGIQIVEQILPFFQPEYTVSIKEVPEMDVVRDVPMVLNSTTYEDNYAGDFTERRAIIYTFNFTAKAYVYGPVSTAKPITKAEVKTYSDLQDQAPTRVQKIVTTVTSGPDADDNFGFNETVSEWT